MTKVVEKELISELELSGVVKNGHFILRSGKHSDTYIKKDLIYCYPNLFSEIVLEIADKITKHPDYMEWVDRGTAIVGPPVAGSILASNVASKILMPFLYPKKILNEDGTLLRMEFDSVFKDQLKYRSIIIIEDVITTGGSVDATIKAIQEADGSVLALFALWEREDQSKKYSWLKAYEPLIKKRILAYEASECKQCSKESLYEEKP